MCTVRAVLVQLKFDQKDPDEGGLVRRVLKHADRLSKGAEFDFFLVVLK